MKKILKTLVFSAVSTLVGASAFAGYGWYDGAMSIGGVTTDCTAWSTDTNAPTELGDLTDMTISSIAFNVWSDSNDRGGANMGFRVFDENKSEIGVLSHDDFWLGASTRIEGKDHDFAISWTGTQDLAATVGLNLEHGKVYYIDMWAKTYGNSGDEWYSGTDNYHATLVYRTPQTVKFDVNDGGAGATCPIESVKCGIGGSYAGFEKPEWANHKFLGWFDDPTAGTRIKMGTEVTEDPERTLFAHWSATQTVNFDLNDGGAGATCSKESTACVIGGKYSGFPAPVWENHKFLGWYDAAEGGTRIKGGVTDVTSAGSRTLYAHWAALQTVNFNLNDGGEGATCSKESVTCNVGGNYAGFPAPVWANHKFLGWFDAAEGGARVKGGMPVTDDAPLTLYAHWRANAAPLAIAGFSMGFRSARATRDATANYKLISSVDNLVDGTYVILTDEDSAYALPATTPGSYFDQVSVTPDANDVIATADSSIVWQIKKDGSGNIALYNEGTQKYAGHAGTDSNSGRLQDDAFYHSVTVASGIFELTSVTADAKGKYRSLQYNSGSTRFAYYKQTQANLRIYAKEDAPTPSTDPSVTLAASATVVHVGDPEVTITATPANFPAGAEVGFIWWVNDEEDAETGSTLTLSTSVAATYVVNVWAYTGDADDPDELVEPTAPVTVTVKVAPPTYTLVETKEDFVLGAKYLIVANVGSSYHALKNASPSGNNNRIDVVQVTRDGKSIVTESDAIVWQINAGVAKSQYVLFNEAEGVYAAAPSSDSNAAQLLSDRTSDYAQWTLGFTDGSELVSIASVAQYGDVSRLLQRNSSSAFFAAYKATSNQKSPSLYRLASQPVQRVTFDVNGEGATCPKAAGTYLVGGTYSEFEKPVWEGHKFHGWFDDPTGGTRIKAGMEVPNDTPLTLYAHWSATQTVTFDLNDGGAGAQCSKMSTECSIGEKYSGFPAPTWENHKFLGWYDAAEGGTRIKGGVTDVTSDASRTLYAHWSALQTVTFNLNDGGEGATCSKTSVTCSVGGTYSGFPAPVWENHKFLGWFDAAEGGARVKGGMPVTDDAPLTLYAHWRANAAPLAISGFAVSPRAAAPAARAAGDSVIDCTLLVETIADITYEIQWTSSLLGDWTVLKHWTAHDDGEFPIPVEVPAGYSTGFLRIVEVDEQ